MASPTSTSDMKILGTPVTAIAYLINSVGVPVVLLGFACYLIYANVPPVVSSHIELLGTTRETLKAMEQTLKASTESDREIVEVQREHRLFMKDVRDQHEAMDKGVSEIKTDVGAVKGDVRVILERVQGKLQNGS